MSWHDWLQLALFFAALLALTRPLGAYMARVFEGRPTRLDPLVRPLERAIYRVAGVDEREQMTWSAYAWALLAFNAAGIVLLFALQEIQGWLPLNPQGFGAVRPDLAFNTAVSFVTNTNWQAYSGETTMSYLTQMLGMTVQNFVSAATGIATFTALARGLIRKTAHTVGNFWVDLTRATLYVLLPLAFVLALLLVSQGVVQTLSPYVRAFTVEGGAQTIAVGPAASQVAIKQLGTNGGGFFNANSTHPFENPTPFTNLLELLALLLIPVALPFSFGKMAGDRRQGWAIFAAMAVLLLAGLGVALRSEVAGNPSLAAAGVAGGANLEGKEVRFGTVNSVLWAVATTATSTGAVNAMHDSLTPLAGMVPLLNMMLGEVIFGGVGSGLYGMLVFVILAVFIAGLMVGRTPEYLGKKIQAHEMKMATLAILIPSACILLGSAVAAVTGAGLSGRGNLGPHGLTEILYAYSSAAGNNGSAFAGLNANTVFYNLTLGIAMLLGRFGVIVPVLAIAGSMAEKKITPPGPGTFPTDGPLFVGLLVAVVVIVGALTFFPALALGPVVEHLLMRAGRAF